MLDGHHNFEVDRLMAEKVLEIHPGARLGAQVCRAFLRRAVHFLITQGIEQILDLGSGIPTAGNVHEVAHKVNPATRVVYVDIDPIAVAHSRAMLKDNPNATAIQGDARRLDRILAHEEVKDLLDFSQPVAALFLLILHVISDDEEAYGAVCTLRDALAPGSYIAISHGTRENAPPGVIEQLEKLGAGSPNPPRYRSRAEILQFFDGLELVEPGLVYMPLWRPEGPDDVFFDEPEQSLGFGGVGRKP